MKLKFVGLFFIFFGIFCNSFSQVQPDEKQISAYNDLNKKYNNSLRVDWNKKSGIPEIITFYNPVSYDKDKEKSSRLFLNDIKELIKYRTKTDTLVEIKTNERKGITHIRYQQKYGDVPVKGGEYVVTVLNDGKIQTAIGFFFNDINIETKPKLTSDEAFKKAFNNPPKGYSLKDSLYSNKLIIYPFEDEFYLAYEIHIPGKRDGESWCYFINASDGKVIEIKSDVINSQANVYLRHPGLDASYTTINPLPHFFDITVLMGTYANILNDESSRAYSGSNDFRYSTSNTHFDEANLYYHVDRIAAYFHGLGFDDFTQITAHAHTDFYDYYDNPDPNASYDPNDHHLRFSDGQGVGGFNSFAREDNIIYHEYTHAVTDYASGGLNYDWNEAGAIHEGNSDYFAKSKTGRTVIGEYACPAYQRDITNPIFPDYQSYLIDEWKEPHEGGELWAACLWDIRDELGSTVADNIILDACYDLPLNCTFFQYIQRILDTDKNNYNGSHLVKLATVFYNKGLFSNHILNNDLYGNHTFYDILYIYNPLFVHAGATITMAPNSMILFGENGSLTINGNATLNVNGSATEPVIFDFGSPNSTIQNGLKFISGSSGTINYCQIRNAYRGIYENGASINISNTAISGCTDGIYLYNSNPTIQDCIPHL